jgi:ribulose-bisphosphate carboxylase large chain
MAPSVQNPPGLAAQVSGERFTVTYRLRGHADGAGASSVAGEAEKAARAMAREICLEQTVEFPGDLLPPGAIPESIVGRIESFEPEEGEAGPTHFIATISYAAETCGASGGGTDLVQFCNVLFGNISILPGIKVMGFDLPDSMLSGFKGPRFGREGLRARLGVAERPLICSALKPMGLSARELADQAYRFALGGIDMIKDDHGLTNQAFSPFDERLELCAKAVARANRESGNNCAYYPNVTGPADQVVFRARAAAAAGAGGILVCPSLVGLDTMRLLAEDDSIGLPVMAHPAFGGSYVTSPENGFSHAALYAGLTRLAGADSTVYPNWGGRFSFSREECARIAAATASPMGALRASFPAPGGGMTTDRARDMLEVYGRDFLVLIGGGLHRRGPDLTANCRYFVDLLESM